MTERLISIAYGVSAGAGLIGLGLSPWVVAPVAMTVGIALELYRGHQRKVAEVETDG